MQRYNLFQSAHNTLQDVLFEGAKSLQQASQAHYEMASPARQKVAEAIAVFQAQVQAKEAYLFPAVDPFEPAIVDAVKQRHHAAAQYANSLQALLKEEKDWPALQQKFYRLMVLQLECMVKGEEMINPVLWRYYSDAELKRLEREWQPAIQQPMLATA
jgi:hypothetical protein